MIEYIASRLSAYLVKMEIIREDEQDVYQYGFDITIYTITSTIGLLLIGIVFGQLKNALFMISALYLLQTYGGGYHASTHFRCFGLMALGLAAGLLLQLCSIPDSVLAVVWVFSTATLLCIPLVLHPNKSYLSGQVKLYSIRSRLVTVLVLLISLTLLHFNILSLACITVGFTMPTLSRIVAWMKRDF